MGTQIATATTFMAWISRTVADHDGNEYTPKTVVYTFPGAQAAKDFAEFHEGILDEFDVRRVGHNPLPPVYGTEGVMYEPHGFIGGYGLVPAKRDVRLLPALLNPDYGALSDDDRAMLRLILTDNAIAFRLNEIAIEENIAGGYALTCQHNDI